MRSFFYLLSSLFEYSHHFINSNHLTHKSQIFSSLSKTNPLPEFNHHFLILNQHFDFVNDLLFVFIFMES